MFILSSIILTSALISSPSASLDGDTRSIVSVKIESQKQLHLLQDAGAKSLSCFDHAGQTHMVFEQEHFSLAEHLHVEYTTIEPSVNEYIKRFDERRKQARERGIGGWFSDFKTWEQVNEKLLQLESSNPDIAQVFTVGTSHEGRSIQGIRITAPDNPGNRKQVLWNGCQHAREWVAVMVPVYIANELVNNWNTDQEVQQFLENTEVIVVPIVNPDGYEFTYAVGGDRFWRKNRRNNSGSCEGVDLNRNWSYAWNGGDSTSNNTCSDTYIGPSAFSEPETQAMRDLVYSLPNLVAHIDFHSYSQLVLEPWASSNNPPPREQIIKALSGAMSDAMYATHGETYVAGTGGDLLYLADGVFPDWTTNEGALSYTIELRPTGSPGFDLPPEEILPTCEESYSAAIEMLRFVNNPISFSFPNGQPTLFEGGTIHTFPIHIEPIFEDELLTGSATVHVRYGGEGPFANRQLDFVVGNEFNAHLPVSHCGLQSEFWFSVQTDDGETHRFPSGNEVFTAGVATEVYGWDMNENPGWSTAGQWEWGIPTGDGGAYGNPDPTSGATGQHVYGYNLHGDYANNLSEQHLTTPLIDVSSYTDIQLQFSRYLNVEQPAYDHATVSVRADSGSWNQLWTNQSTIEDNQWQLEVYDISDSVGESSFIELRWTMGETDGGWTYSGWNIDDVQIVSSTETGVLGDVTCDGTVNVNDVLSVVSNWGPCSGYCSEDIVPDSIIDVSDLLQVIGNW